MRRPAVLFAPLVALAAACGSTDPTSERGDPADEYVEVLATVFTSGGGGPSVDEVTARCTAAAMVDVVGVPALRGADISPQELADADDLRSLGLQIPADAVATLAADLDACGLGAQLEEAFVLGLAEESGGELSAEAVACVVEASSSTALVEGLAATFVDTDNGDAGYEEVTAAVAECPSAITELLLNGFEQSRGAPLDDGTRTCVAELVAREDSAAATFNEGGEAADAFGALLIDTCPGLVAG